MADCEMNLRRFPFDTQRCPLLISVFGYFDNQVKLQWGNPKAMQPFDAPDGQSLEINSKIKVAGWRIANVTVSEFQDVLSWKGIRS